MYLHLLYNAICLQKIRAYMTMIQGNVRTSMDLKLIGIIYGGLLAANAFPYGIVLFNMSHLIVLFYVLNIPP